MLERITQRRLVEAHDGRSGARIERGLLDGKTPVYIKTSEVANDIVGLATGDPRRELRLHRAGLLDRLPDGLASAVLDIEDRGDQLVTITRDLGRAVLAWDVMLGLEQVRAIFTGITAVHRHFAGRPPSGLCPLDTRLTLFAPWRLGALRPANPGLVEAIARGQELLADLIPSDVADAIHRCYHQPGPLASSLNACDSTLLHGDFYLPNVAIEDTTLIPLDWGMATTGPAALDLITFCLSAMSNVAIDRATLLAEARNACRDLCDDETFARCEFWALMELGWNKALDAVDHPDPAKQATERGDLDFWVRQATSALDAGLLPLFDDSPRP